MSIRMRHLDFTTDGMKLHSMVSLGDVTATRQFHIFTAPYACVVHRVDLFSNEANPPATTTASTTNLSATLQRADTSAIMVARGTSATETTTNAISANVRYSLTPSGNNSLSVGTPVELLFTVAGSGTISGVLIDVIYSPLIHRESR